MFDIRFTWLLLLVMLLCGEVTNAHDEEDIVEDDDIDSYVETVADVGIMVRKICGFWEKKTYNEVCLSTMSLLFQFFRKYEHEWILNKSRFESPVYY